MLHLQRIKINNTKNFKPKLKIEKSGSKKNELKYTEKKEILNEK